MTRAISWLELQEGKPQMSGNEQHRLSSNIVCVIRRVQASAKFLRFPTKDK